MALRSVSSRALILLGLLLADATPAIAADVTLQIDATNPSHQVSPRLVGIFIEDINFGVDGGLNAELVKNGSFEFPQSLMGWKTVDQAEAPSGGVEVRHDRPAFDTNSHYLRFSLGELDREVGVTNEGYRGMGVRAGEDYRFSASIRSLGSTPATLKLILVDEDGTPIAQATIDEIAPDWNERTAILQPSRTAFKARLVLLAHGATACDIDMVSLCPVKTWKNRPHGLRENLVQTLADLKPAFFRFPGGCIVEGSELADRYQWKQTIGNLPDRRLNFNRWNTVFRHRPTPDYYQSYVLGFFEYFQLAEDIGAEPLPILHCGLACQFQSAEQVPLDELQPYIDDALDLIEFANGPVTSEWGAKRAAMGHPEPFHMKLLGVGNEQWGPEYFERYEAFAKALKEKHPEIELVSGTGPFPNDPKFHYAWPRLRALKADIVDEHCYAMPDWFLRSATRFDDYDRHGPKVFMGEYAVQTVDICSPDNRNTLRGALAEAAFLTGIERNSDVVTMSAYAPLLGHVDAWQWRPNLIWFDNLDVVRTPNYYVQQMFSRHRSDTVLPVKLSDTRPPVAPHGRIGLSTDGASAEFKDLRVEVDEKADFTADQLPDASAMSTFRGQWELDGNQIRQTQIGEAARAQFGDTSWRDCTISLRVRKTAGSGGIGILFRNSEGGSFLEWSLGGNDQQSRITAHLASHSEDRNIVEEVPGKLAADRWYDLQVELRGDEIRCYVDGRLVHDVAIPNPELARIYAVAGRDTESKDIILKVVNPTSHPTETSISLGGIDSNTLQAELTLLTGNPDDENSLADPDHIRPETSIVKISGRDFVHTFPPNSLSILRINAK